jgi:hypothetical protein
MKLCDRKGCNKPATCIGHQAIIHGGAKFALCREHMGMEPDYTKKCIICGATPVMPITEMCGPCTTGEADTVDGNW